MSGQGSPPARRAQVSRQHPHRGRLARAVGAEQTDDLAPPDIKPDAIDCFERAEPLREPINMNH